MSEVVVLGLDCAGETAGVALLRGQTLLYEDMQRAGRTHSRTLLPMVDAALRACGLCAADVGLFALSAGPGSFTGLRIGMALIKGLAAAANTPCAPVSTLEALAAGCPCAGLLVPALDARRGQVYTAAFLREAPGALPRRLAPDALMPAAQALAAARAAAPAAAFGPPVLLGEGAALCLPPDEPGAAVLVPAQSCRTALGAARLGQAAAAAGAAMPPGQLRPAYHQLCQAESERIALTAPKRAASAAAAGAPPLQEGD